MDAVRCICIILAPVSLFRKTHFLGAVIVGILHVVGRSGVIIYFFQAVYACEHMLFFGLDLQRAG